LIKLCNVLGCKFNIYKRFRKHNVSKYSTFTITGSQNCLIFGSFLYKDSIGIGFQRKKERFDIMVKKIKIHIQNKVNIWKNIPKKIKQLIP